MSENMSVNVEQSSSKLDVLIGEGDRLVRAIAQYALRGDETAMSRTMPIAGKLAESLALLGALTDDERREISTHLGVNGDDNGVEVAIERMPVDLMDAAVNATKLEAADSSVEEGQIATVAPTPRDAMDSFKHKADEALPFVPKSGEVAEMREFEVDFESAEARNGAAEVRASLAETRESISVVNTARAHEKMKDSESGETLLETPERLEGLQVTVRQLMDGSLALDQYGATVTASQVAIRALLALAEADPKEGCTYLELSERVSAINVDRETNNRLAVMDSRRQLSQAVKSELPQLVEGLSSSLKFTHEKFVHRYKEGGPAERSTVILTISRNDKE